MIVLKQWAEHPSSPADKSILIEDFTFSFPFLLYSQNDLAWDAFDSDKPHQLKHMHNVANLIRSGHYSSIINPLHACTSNHWLAAKIDLQNKHLLVGDSLVRHSRPIDVSDKDWKGYNRLANKLGATLDSKAYQLPHEVQDDGYSCGDVTFNTIEHAVFPNVAPWDPMYKAALRAEWALFLVTRPGSFFSLEDLGLSADIIQARHDGRRLSHHETVFRPLSAPRSPPSPPAPIATRSSSPSDSVTSSGSSFIFVGSDGDSDDNDGDDSLDELFGAVYGFGTSHTSPSFSPLLTSPITSMLPSSSPPRSSPELEQPHDLKPVPPQLQQHSLPRRINTKASQQTLTQFFKKVSREDAERERLATRAEREEEERERRESIRRQEALRALRRAERTRAKNRLRKQDYRCRQKEKKRLEKEHIEEERLEKEHLKKERLEKERLEMGRIEKERLEKDRSATERELVDAIVIASYASTWTTDKSVDAIQA
ncbi:uncharacterized protein STEHIDRAFT_158058 [Stereum hirsutum FP-91666 SS1]|uniref:uncharacterized protein n=1 Tax=Stereum hirsutum (strain FP-91666) TaxID=721885 RepID=UPI0004449B00|nr:uncharacterized protein STEHIDRAFT_158058 [Stereum hirsutum FP-91666 SS1]EIM85422.1 hypothetical protein STEHIDRAFT_158058 [Stereum hirsutum FP-91666 SS1]